MPAVFCMEKSSLFRGLVKLSPCRTLSLGLLLSMALMLVCAKFVRQWEAGKAHHTSSFRRNFAAKNHFNLTSSTSRYKFEQPCSNTTPKFEEMSRSQPRWLLYAIASGACAALNGVFAKLTTTKLTATWAMTLSHSLGLREPNAGIEATIRGVSHLYHSGL